MKHSLKKLARIEALEARIAPAVIAEIPLAFSDNALGGVSGGDLAGSNVSSAGDVNGDGYADFLVSAHEADGGGNNRGAVYVVFGKPDGFFPNNHLASLGGGIGFKITGGADGDLAGFSAAAAGDVNDDGFSDIIVGAHMADGAGTNRGAAYLFYGHSGNFNAELSIAANAGTKFAGLANDDAVGFSVSGGADFNQDGIDDLVIGAPFANEGGTDRGAAYVVFGKKSSFGFNFDLASLNGTNGFKLTGLSDGDQFGSSVGFLEYPNYFGSALIAGAIGADEGGTNRGAAYVMHSRQTSVPHVVVSQLSSGFGFKLSGAADGDGTGVSVSDAGDVNGDGLTDMIIGAQLNDFAGTNSGTAYVVFGSGEFSFPNIALGSLNGTNGFKITGAANNELAGFSAKKAGDVNGDGLSDIIVGASGAGGGAGAAYVVFGKSNGLSQTVPLSGINGTNGFKVSGFSGIGAGTSVSGAGDVDGDGFADIIVGAPYYDAGGTDKGAAYLIKGFGTAEVDISTSGKSATFTDWDGDIVTVKTTKGSFAASQFKLSSPNPLTGGSHLVFADFVNSDLAGAAISITSKSAASGGDGLVNVGTIDATGLALAQVIVDGNVRKIDATSVATISTYSFGLVNGEEISGEVRKSRFTGNIGKLTVKTDWNYASLEAAAIGTFKIGGNITEPSINADSIVSFLVGGDFDGTGSDYNLNAGKIGAIAIGGTIGKNSFINVGGHAGKITVGGSWSGTFFGGTVGPIVVKGSLDSLLLRVNGIPNPGTAAKAVALKSLTVGGSVLNANIGGGSHITPDASLGPVLVKGQWVASSIFAGITEGNDNILGTADDTLFPNHSSSIVSKIASITILGAVSGNVGFDFGLSAFGFVAEEIGYLKIGKSIVPLQKGPRNDAVTRFLGTTIDVRVREVAA
jgi:hypothetical protein